MRMPPLFMNATGFYSSCKCLHFQIQQYNYQHFNGIEQAFYDTWEFLVTYVNKDIIANQNKFEFTKRLYNLQDYFWWLFSPTRKYFIIHQEFSSTHWYYKSRSWFGLITQVSLAYYISPTMKPFKDLLKPNIKFYWDHHLDTLLHQSNYHITAAVKDVIKTFDPKRNLFTNWLELWWYRLSPPSETFWLHCKANINLLSWLLEYCLCRIKFKTPAESCYSPTEGEALALMCSLKHSRMFIKGYTNLIMPVDHTPLFTNFQQLRLQ